MRYMNVLQVVNEFAMDGGVGSSVRSLERSLGNYHGMNIDTLVEFSDLYGDSRVSQLKRNGYTYPAIGPGSTLDLMKQYDVIHLHTFPSYQTLSLIEQHKESLPKIILTCHSNVKTDFATHIEHSRKQFEKGKMSAHEWLKLQQQIPALNDHNNHTDTMWGYAMARQERSINIADYVHHMNPAYLKSIIDTYGSDPAKHKIIPWGVQIKPKQPLTPNNSILYCGRFSGEKGIDELLEAIPLAQAKDNNIMFEFAGGTPAEVLEAKQKLAQYNADLQKVTFHGWVSDKNKLEQIYQNNATVVAPSKDESFGLAIAEALNNSRVVLMTPTDSLRSSFIDKRMGLPLYDRTPEGIASSLVDTINRPSHELVKIGSDSKDALDAHYNIDNIMNQFAGLYRGSTS